MIDIVDIGVEARNRAVAIDVHADGGDRSRRVERRDRPIRAPNNAMINQVPVLGVSSNGAASIDTLGIGAVRRFRRIEYRERSIHTANIAVKKAPAVLIK